MNEEARVKSLLEKYSPKRENLLDILHELQDNDPENHLTEEALRQTAAYLDLSLAEVRGAASFYSLYGFAPRGRHIIRLCDSPPCLLMGGTSVLERIKQTLGIGLGETTPDGAFTLELASCLGVCGVAPAMMIDTQVYGNLTEERVTAILDKVRRDDETA
jgi:NADH-quinone oxidoreductase subunit E